MTELLLPRLKQEIEARLAELRPLVEEIEQLEAAKAALLARAELPAAPLRRRAAARNGAAPAAPSSSPSPAPAAAAAPARRRRAARAAPARRAEAADGDRAPRGANRDAILQLVEERPGVSVAEIASVTKIAKPTVATTVSKLKREGVLADEAGGVKLASRQPLTIAGPAAADKRPDGVSDAEWEEAAPAAGGGDAAASDDAA
ncbi:winged helix-turn-helix domain-containing protein [Conexibacter sp. CPCC 206217]|uniref:winged helix-turn-helix transcriptional regulator n=1 Tax=Conexibacter sp. CPCC 206217 TaxID=3064574 RepID=UPI002728B7EA|nr:winged helix-turn-helix domain-containing protein [Conexibacter sp. CPCC 206217]MDO8213752.1 winged helix-turn-helix domain-containing protein [Conexibacter sp. CPCC 206217]